MTVKRYRDVADMPAPLRGDPADPSTYARIKQLWSFSGRLAPPLFGPGVYRYRSIDESHAAREQRTIERMRAIRAIRTRGTLRG